MKKWWTKSTLERIMNTWCHFNAIWARNKLYYFTSSCVFSLTSRTNEKKKHKHRFQDVFRKRFLLRYLLFWNRQTRHQTIDLYRSAGLAYRTNASAYALGMRHAYHTLGVRLGMSQATQDLPVVYGISNCTNVSIHRSVFWCNWRARTRIQNQKIYKQK